MTEDAPGRDPSPAGPGTPGPWDDLIRISRLLRRKAQLRLARLETGLVTVLTWTLVLPLVVLTSAALAVGAVVLLLRGLAGLLADLLGSQPAGEAAAGGLLLGGAAACLAVALLVVRRHHRRALRRRFER